MTKGIPETNRSNYGVKYLNKEQVATFREEYKQPKVSPNTGVKGDSNTKYLFNEPSYGYPKAPPKAPQGQGKEGTIGTSQPTSAKYPEQGTSPLGGVTHAPSEVKNTVPSTQGKRIVDVGVGQQAKETFDKTEGKGDKFEGKRSGRKTERAVSAQAKRDIKDKKIRNVQSEIIHAKRDEAVGKLQGTGGKQPPKPEKERASSGGEDREDHRQYNRAERKTPHRPTSKRPNTGYYDSKTDKVTNKAIKQKAQETIINAQLLKLNSQRYVKPTGASAGKKPATKLPNAGGIQNKLDQLKDESENANSKNYRTGTSATGSEEKVRNRYA
jgi:hypothetical protein